MGFRNSTGGTLMDSRPAPRPGDSITAAMPRKRTPKRPPKARPVGRPVGSYEGEQQKKRYQVMLEPGVADRLRDYGDGNLSAGIAKAAGKIK